MPGHRLASFSAILSFEKGGEVPLPPELQVPEDQQATYAHAGTADFDPSGRGTGKAGVLIFDNFSL
jgi:hypothetical protein